METLDGKARKEWLEIYVKDVRDNPEAYDLGTAQDEALHASALNIIAGLSTAEVRRMTRELRQEIKKVARYAK